MIKVCHLITDLDAGGAERMLANLVASVDRSRFIHEIVTLVPPGSMAREIESAGVPVTSLGMHRGSAGMRGLISFVQYMRRFRPAILQTWLYHADLLGFVVSCLAPDTRLVWNLRCSDLATAPDQTRLRHLIRTLAFLSSRVDTVVVNSAAGRHFHADAGYRPKRWVQIPNGVAIDRFRPRPEQRMALRAGLGLGAEDWVIGLVARFHPMKDHETFLRAAALLARRNRNARFVLCGQGCDPGSEPLQRLIGELDLVGRVRLLGIRGDMEAVYPSLDILALSSAYGEGFPNVLIEAMACGVSCVATKVGDSQEILGDKGFVVSPRDPEGLASACERMAAEDQASASLGLRDWITERYSLDAVRRRYEGLYETLGAPQAAA